MDTLTIYAPGIPFDWRVTPVTGDRLIHPADQPNEIGRIVLRWGPVWVPQTKTASDYFAKRRREGEDIFGTDAEVAGWLMLRPESGSLADMVRSGDIDVATALSAEAEVWPEGKLGPAARTQRVPGGESMARH
ncbi:hypothetical protein [Amycolatopsis anabasis]|uniref:hypothetical protein n=1 Tax=Amycolatopsis anabasis TaxID=1840409 RepID=UPI00131BF4D4|nr:hypothetical protein [Amycolatopsis anabasis]